MRTTLVVLLGLCALIVADPIPTRTADKEFLGKQKDILRLFVNVNQPSYFKDLIEIANNFKLDENFDKFERSEFAKEFYYYYKHDILPQGEIFSPFNPDHLKQAIALFKTLYHAKDYETFFRCAVWARQNVNAGMFVYATSIAIVNSKLTDDLILPPIYEIFPQYFYNDEVIYKAKQYKQHYFTYGNEKVFKDGSFKGYTIEANYSGQYLNLHPEQSMSYFTEDVGLNSYYYIHHIFLPYWMETEYYEISPKYNSEMFYYLHQQILARYYLERLSNGFGEIPHFDYEYPIETGYYPSLTYANGLKFPTRPNHANLYYHGVHGKQTYPSFGNYSYSYSYVKDFERRIRDVLDKGYYYTQDGKSMPIYTKEGAKTFLNLVAGKLNSPHSRFYGNINVFARKLLGYSYYPLDEYKLAPSALEQYETSLRDPMFYQMFKRILSFIHQYQNNVGPYKKRELLFKGVEVKDFESDRLITYFDYFYSDLGNAVVLNEAEFNEDTFKVRARQYRLNHKPFNYRIKVNSDKQTEAFVKIFIGPKYDEYGREIDMKTNYRNFFEIDRFNAKLQQGENVLERSSRVNKYFSKDRTTYKQLYKQILTAYNGGEPFRYYPEGMYYVLPQRLLLPKGQVGGQTFQIFVTVSEQHQFKEEEEFEEYLVDPYYSIAYPFDRPVKFEEDFFVPNFFAKDVVIYHKNSAGDINSTDKQY